MSHIPVLQKEVTEIVKILSPKISIDFTFGAGGHTKIILNNSNSTVFSFDRDISTKKFADHITEKRFFYINDVSSNIDKYNDIKHVDFILADLGLSQMQLTESRGFSYLTDDELNMQMGVESLGKISSLINSMSEYKLQQIIRIYGEDKQWKKITNAIIEARKKKNIITTFQLKDIIKNAIGDYHLYKTLSRCFQALRMYTNNEINILQDTLNKSLKILNNHGCMAFIGFHSIENKIIKDFFKTHLNNIKIFSPTEEEISMNPQSRSALLRIGFKSI